MLVFPHPLLYVQLTVYLKHNICVYICILCLYIYVMITYTIMVFYIILVYLYVFYVT